MDITVERLSRSVEKVVDGLGGVDGYPLVELLKRSHVPTWVVLSAVSRLVRYGTMEVTPAGNVRRVEL